MDCTVNDSLLVPVNHQHWDCTAVLSATKRYIIAEVKVNITISQATKAQRGAFFNPAPVP
jgi:hypothetical protein